MCGICGIVPSKNNSTVDAKLLRRMTDTLYHRGPDSEGFYTAPGIGLGIRRLSIIDLETGDQPIANEDGNVTVVCNGEIYNYRELRRDLEGRGHLFRTRSDVEVIAHLYEDHKEECLKYLRGMFALAVWDGRAQRLLLARDRLGIKPLVYAQTSDGFYFASEAKAILLNRGIRRQADPAALCDLFSYGFITAPRTLFSGIRRLPDGHYLIVKDGEVTIRRYWHHDFTGITHERRHWGVNDYAEALLHKLDETVALHMRSDVEVGAWLSPGVDSSAVTSLMRKYCARPVKVFLIGFEDPETNEIGRCSTLASYPAYDLKATTVLFKTSDFDLFPKALWHSEDPLIAGIEIARLLLSKATARDVKVVLTGEGADEVLGGYQWYAGDRILRPFARYPLMLRKIAAACLAGRWPGAASILLSAAQMDSLRYTGLIGGGIFADTKRRIFQEEYAHAWMRRHENDFLPQAFGRWHPMEQLQYHDLTKRLPDAITYQLDRSSMSHSVEARVPFLDHELVEFCSRIPPSLKLKGLREKYILRKALQKELPPEICWRRKHAFNTPTAQWLRSDLPDFAKELLSERALKEKGYFDPGLVTQVLAGHRARRANYANLLMAVLGVQLWDDMFIQENRYVV